MTLRRVLAVTMRVDLVEGTSPRILWNPDADEAEQYCLLDRLTRCPAFLYPSNIFYRSHVREVHRDIASHTNRFQEAKSKIQDNVKGFNGQMLANAEVCPFLP